jgi:hypothetical protein
MEVAMISDTGFQMSAANRVARKKWLRDQLRASNYRIDMLLEKPELTEKQLDRLNIENHNRGYALNELRELVFHELSLEVQDDSLNIDKVAIKGVD